MSEIQNKTILELTSLKRYLYDDAIPVLRYNLSEDNCIALGDIIWFNTATNQLIINGRHKFDMSSLIQANIYIKLTGDSGITDFTYSGQSYDKGESIKSEKPFNASIKANINEHYTFTKWQFENTDIYTSNPLLYNFTESGELKAITAIKQYTITVNTDSSLGTVKGGGSYNYGLSCTITATANSGYKFVRWTKNGNQVSTSSSYTFTVDENATYTAVFELAIPDYYVGQALNRTTFQGYDNELILSNCNGFTLSLNPVYPSSSTYQQLTGTNKLMFVLIKNTLNVSNIKVDINNPGETFDLNNQVFTDVFTYEDTITTEDGQYKIYWTYDSEYTTENGFRIKFNQ